MAFEWNQFWSNVDAQRNGGSPQPPQPAKSFYSVARNSRKESQQAPGVMAPKPEGLSSSEMASQARISARRGPGPGGLPIE
jgi:hypothetical protein